MGGSCDELAVCWHDGGCAVHGVGPVRALSRRRVVGGCSGCIAN